MNGIYFASFGVSNEIKKIIGKKNITIKIYKTQTSVSAMCGHFCIGFIDLSVKIIILH